MDRKRIRHTSKALHAEENIKPVRSAAAWERVMTRYFAANHIPLKWEYIPRRFTGIAGHVFARLNPKQDAVENVWVRMPEYVKRYEKNEDGKNAIVFVTNRAYGDNIDDSLVVLRLGTFVPMLKAFIDSDKERWKE